jgi:hypothetical protein
MTMLLWCDSFLKKIDPQISQMDQQAGLALSSFDL